MAALLAVHSHIAFPATTITHVPALFNLLYSRSRVPSSSTPPSSPTPSSPTPSSPPAPPQIVQEDLLLYCKSSDCATLTSNTPPDRRHTKAPWLLLSAVHLFYCTPWSNTTFLCYSLPCISTLVWRLALEDLLTAYSSMKSWIITRAKLTMHQTSSLTLRPGVVWYSSLKLSSAGKTSP